MIHHTTGDIIEMNVDAIVNAANTELLPGGGVCGQIHKVSGPELDNECRKLGGCQYGEAKLTKGYNLPAKFVIHTVGPIYGQHDGNEPEILYSCYYESMKLANTYKLTSIAFPQISTGTYGYRVNEAKPIAEQALKDFMEDNPDTSITDIYLVEYVGIKKTKQPFLIKPLPGETVNEFKSRLKAQMNKT